MSYSSNSDSVKTQYPTQMHKILDNMEDQNVNIMLIDDDEASHIIHKINIEDAGFKLTNVVSCYGVDESINKLKSILEDETMDTWPDYIFLDINMPRKTGYDFINEFEIEFKNLNGNNNTPKIYLVSSSINPRDLLKAKELNLIQGFQTKFLEKTFIRSLLAS